MKKSVLKFATGSLLLVSTVLAAIPPVHSPVTGYNYQNTNQGYSKSILTNTTSHSSTTVLDIAVSQNYHFECGTATFTGTGSRMFICKKDATTGAPLGMNNANVGILYGDAQTTDICKGMLLDEANNRVYVFGTTQFAGQPKSAAVICYNMTTLAVETNFSYGFGTQVVSSTNTESELTDMALTYSGSFLALVNVKDQNNKNYLSLVSISILGDWTCWGQISETAYQCYGNRIKYDWDNRYFIAGKAVNASAQSVPMVWEVSSAGGTTSDCFHIRNQSDPRFVNPVVGFGEFVDCDFDYTHGQSEAIIAIGNNNSGQGIWAQYIYTNPNTYITVPTSTFTNTSSLPGTTSTRFSRCLVQPDGYTIVLGRAGSTTYDGKLGYITPSGNAYVQTQALQLKEATGLNKCQDGNIVIGGCNGNLYHTAKFTSYATTWWNYVNKTTGLTVNEQHNDLHMEVFPNPVNNILTVNYSGITTNHANIQIIDISGKKVKELNDVNVLHQQTNLDINDLRKGTYFIRLTTDEKSVMEKIIKQ